MSEQGAVPEIPSGPRNCCICGAMLLDGKCMSCGHQQCPKCELYVKPPSIAALTLERDTLKATVARLSAPVSDEDGWLIERGGLCIGMECNTAAWVTFTHPQAIRFSREQDAENMLTSLRSFGHGKAFHDCIVTGHTWVAARASTPPAHPINEDDQRRKDAAWNDRAKARCVCGEMIAWYSGEYLHVAGRSGLCADGRLASPAHFLVGMPPAEPEWKKERS